MSFDKQLYRQLPLSSAHIEALINVPVASPYPVAGAGIPLLPLPDHLALFRFYRDTPDPLLKRVAGSALILCNYRLVLAWAMKLSSQTVPFRELVSAGVDGLQHGITMYDPESGNRPSTYLTYWIRNRILLERRTAYHLIHIPRNVLEDEDRMAKGVPVRGKNPALQRWGSMMRVVDSLDVPLYEGDTEGDFMVDQVTNPDPHPAMMFEERELGEVLKEALGRLPEAWRTAITHYFELGDVEKLNFRELSEAMGTSPETQSYRIKQGLKQLRALPELQAFWG